MAEERITSQEEHSESNGTAQQETPNPMDSIMKELAEMRKENKKLHRRLDAIFDAKAKKSLFPKRKRPSVDPSCSDAVRKTYNELVKKREDFTGFATDVRYDHDGNQEVEKVLVKEVRGSFGKQKWNKAEIKGAICQYWRSIRDDAIRKKNGKLKEHRVMTRRRLRVKRKLIHRQEMVEKASLSQEDKRKVTELLNQENAVEFMSSEESEEDEEDTRTGPPKRHVKPLQWERSKLRTIKALLDATYQARMSSRQKRTAAKVLRVAGQNLSTRPLPNNCPSWAGRAVVRS